MTGAIEFGCEQITRTSRIMTVWGLKRLPEYLSSVGGNPAFPGRQAMPFGRQAGNDTLPGARLSIAVLVPHKTAYHAQKKKVQEVPEPVFT